MALQFMIGVNFMTKLIMKLCVFLGGSAWVAYWIHAFFIDSRFKGDDIGGLLLFFAFVHLAAAFIIHYASKLND